MKVDFDLLHRFGELPEIVAIGYDRNHPNQQENYKLYNDILENIVLFFDSLTESEQFAIETHQKLKQLNQQVQLEPRPFDKLKKLWDEWKKADDYQRFEFWFKESKLNQRMISRDNILPEIHQQLAEHCGFLTTAEVRQAVQELKNQ